MKNKISLDQESVKRVAKLARINLKGDEAKRFASQLTDVLEYVNRLKEVDVSNVVPISQVTGLENIVRKDVAQPSLSSKESLENCPETYNQLVKSLPVFEK